MKRIDSKKRPIKKKVIYLVGEGTGETISRIARASLVQFNRENVEVKTFFLVTDKKYVSRIIKQAAEDEALVAFSIVQPVLRDFLIQEAVHHGIKAIDVIGDFIVQLSIFLKEKPKVLFSTGAEIAIPSFYIGKFLFRTKLIYLECSAQVYSPSLTGRWVYPISDLFLVQWESLLQHYGPKANYVGGLI